MIHVRHLDKRFSGSNRVLNEYDMEWRGQSLADIAPEGSGVAAINDKVVKETEPGWHDPLPDGSTVNFIMVEGAQIVGIVVSAALLAVGVPAGVASVVSTVAATAAGLYAGYRTIKALVGIFNPALPGTPSGGGGGGQRPSFGFDPPQNQIQIGGPIPVVYGRYRTGGSIVAAWRDPYGNYNNSLFILVALSEGPIHSIGQYTTDQDNLKSGTDTMPLGMRINGMDANELKGVELSLRLGSTSQTAMHMSSGTQPGFRDFIYREYAHNFELDDADNQTGEAIFVWESQDVADMFWVHIEYPGGLGGREADDETGELNDIGVSANYVIKVYELDGVTEAQNLNNPLENASRSVTDSGSEQGRRRFFVLRSHPIKHRSGSTGRYIVKVWKTSPSPGFEGGERQSVSHKCTITSIIERVPASLTYPGVALVGMRILATAQVGNGFPNITFDVMGRLCGNSVDSTAWSNNPADVVKDMLTNTRYGGGMHVDPTFIDSDSYDEFNDWNNEYIAKWTGATSTWNTLTGTTAANGTTVITGVGTDFDGSVAGSEPLAPEVIEGDAIRLSSDLDDVATVVRVIDADTLWVDRPLGDGTSQTINVNSGIERRHMFDGTFDQFLSLWEAVKGVCGTARAIPIKIGNVIKTPIFKPKSAVQLFGMGNIKEDSHVRSWPNASEVPDRIVIDFANQEQNYERVQLAVESEDIDGTREMLKEETIEAFGVTRPTQANRMAYAALRETTLPAYIGSFETGVDSIQVEPLDVVKLAHFDSISGRVAGVNGSGFVQLDRPYTFEADTIYTYVEIDDDGTRAEKDFKTSAGTVTELTFAPLHGAGYLGRVYALGRKFETEEEVIITAITSSDEHMMRRLEYREYVEQVYTDDAPSIDPDITVVTYGSPPGTVTGLQVDQEQGQSVGVSELDLSWTAPASGGAVGSYSVYYYAGGTPATSDDLLYAGSTTATDFELDIEYPQGTTVYVCVQTVGQDGQSTSLSIDTTDAYVITYVLRRETNGDDIATFPGNVSEASLSIGSCSGNACTLSWTAVTTDIDGNAFPGAGTNGHEVRVGNWLQGPVIFDSSSGNSVAIKRPRCTRRYIVRAWYTESNLDDYYSPAAAIVDAAPVIPTGYMNLASPDSGPSGEFTLSSDGTASNAYVYSGHHEYAETLIQSIGSAPFTYTTNETDLGSSAETHVSYECRVRNWLPSTNNSNLYGSMMQWTAEGNLSLSTDGSDNEYLTWTLLLDYKVLTGDSWSTVDAKALVNDDIIVTGRYFRFRLQCEANVINGVRPSRAALEYFETAFSRA